MNSVSNLEENFGEYLKQKTEHRKYEFQTVIHYGSDMKENKMYEVNWKNIHIRKEATDCKYEQHMNPCKKCRPWLYNFIKILLKTYTTKITFVSTLSPSSGGIFIALGFPRMTSGNQNLLQQKDIL